MGVLEDLYREVILQHYQSPRNRRTIPDANVQGYAQNPLCGDEMAVAARVDGGRIVDAAYEARGCSISHASADMMADAVRGKTLEEVSQILDAFKALMTDSAAPPSPDLGELSMLQSVRRYPVRVKCALLPWTTLADALASTPC